MAEKTLNVKILHVTKTTAEWNSDTTTIIGRGLLCVELTDDGKTLVKIGNGEKTYPQLSYITDGIFDISNYYTKTEVSDEIDSKISALGNIIQIKGVKETLEQLPTTDNAVGDLWFVGSVTDTTDSFREYIYTSDNKFEYLGHAQTEVDLSSYATQTYVSNTINPISEKVTTLEGKVNTLESYDFPSFVSDDDTIVINCVL